jgi:hypothetical protein
VAMAVRQSDAAAAATPPPVAAATDAPIATDAPAAAPPVTVSPQDAAALASSVISDPVIYSVESSSFNGVNAYKVTFSSGSIVFVGSEGRILSVNQVQPTAVATPSVAAPVYIAPSAPAAPTSRPRHSSSSSSGGETGGEYEGGADD